MGNFANPDWRGATVEGCVSVMQSLPDVAHKGRICGLIPENDHSGRNITLAGNKAYGKMGIENLAEGADQKDGESISFAAATDLNIYLASGFSADVWAMGRALIIFPC